MATHEEDFELKIEPFRAEDWYKEIYMSLMYRMAKDLSDINCASKIYPEVKFTIAGGMIIAYDVSWNNWPNDLRELSKLYPNLLLVLRRWGTYHDQLSKCYAKNGKIQFSSATITFDEFDPEKLE